MLNSFEPPPARVFAWRQLRLMREQGLSRKQAQRAVQAREDSGQRCATLMLLRSDLLQMQLSTIAVYPHVVMDGLHLGRPSAFFAELAPSSNTGTWAMRVVDHVERCSCLLCHSIATCVTAL